MNENGMQDCLETCVCVCVCVRACVPVTSRSETIIITLYTKNTNKVDDIYPGYIIRSHFKKELGLF